MSKPLTLALQVLAVAYALLALVLAVMGLGADDGARPPAAVGLSILSTALFVGTAVVFGLWLADVHARSPGEGKHTRGWTVGSWYIPFGTVATPHAPMLEVWRRSTGRGPGAAIWTWLGAWSAWWILASVLFVGGLVLGVDAGLQAFGSGDESEVEVDVPAWMTWAGLAQAVFVAVAAGGLVASTRAMAPAASH